MTVPLSRILIAFLLTLIFAAPAAARWPDDPAENMVICDRSGEQAVTKIAIISDGGCYVSWYDNSSGNYDVYLQRLDGDGDPQWAEGGLLVSNHPQETWVTDYDLAKDGENHAIVVINDIRDGADRDIFAYRISPDGDFVWGADGLTLSDNDGFEPDPQVIVTDNDGPAFNMVFAWQEDDAIHLRKVSPAGADLWDPATLTLESTYGYSIPRLVSTGYDGFILQCLLHTGSSIYDPKHIVAFKIDADGNHAWSPTGETVSDAGGIAVYMRPELMYDDEGGAYSYWYDTRNMDHHAYVQHILIDGTMAWTPNGVSCSTTPGLLQMMPSIAEAHISGNMIVFFPFTNANQTRSGVGAQRLGKNGERLWTDDGLVLVPLAEQTRWSITAHEQAGYDTMVTYLDDLTVLNSKLKAIRVDGSGNQVWDTSPVELTSNDSGKGLVASSRNSYNQVICAWEDDRNDGSGDIYLQNINPDGSLGPLSSGPHDPYLLIGLGAAYDNPPLVRLIPPEQDGEYIVEFQAYGPTHYGVRVHCGNVDEYDDDEVITGPGPGEMFGPHVRGFSALGGPITGLSFLAYGTHKFGVNVTTGDFDGDSIGEIITGPGPGAVFGPHVRGWNFDGGWSVTPIPGVSYFAYGAPKYGVNVCCGDIDGDGYDEIVTGAGPGAVYGPHVRGWNVDGGAATAIPAVSFLAYGTHKWGVNVSCGDVDGDGIDEIVTAPGPSGLFGAHIRGWNLDGGAPTPLPGFSFFAWNPSEALFGARVFASTDLDDDGWDELLTGAGPDPDVGTPVKAWNYDGTAVSFWFSLDAYPEGWTHGADVTAGLF